MVKPWVHVYTEDSFIACPCGERLDIPDGWIDTEKPGVALSEETYFARKDADRVEAMCPQCGRRWRLDFTLSEIEGDNGR